MGPLTRRQLDLSTRVQSVARKIERDIFHRGLTVPPEYYTKIVECIFAYPELPRLLLQITDKTEDQSVELFLMELESIYQLSRGKKFGVLCSGSGLLSKGLVESGVARVENIEHFDSSATMLKYGYGVRRCHRVDLGRRIVLKQKYDVLLLMGGLRYLALQIDVLCQNILSMLAQDGIFLVAEIDRTLVHAVASRLREAGLIVRENKRAGSFFRNTLLYFMLDRYKKDSYFRILLGQWSELRKMEPVEGLLELAGVKRTFYYYCGRAVM